MRTTTNPGDYAGKSNAMKKYVASTTLQKPAWNNTNVINGEVTKPKQHSLLDELQLWVHPVFLGTASSSDLIFREGFTSILNFVDAETLGSGVVVLSYQPA